MKKQDYLDHLVGVFGQPVAENPGVVIQDAAFATLGLERWRFLTIDVDKDQLENAIRKGAKTALAKLELFDVYRGVQVAPGKKSVAFSLTLRNPDHTLTDGEADEIVGRILRALEEDCGAVLRA